MTPLLPYSQNMLLKPIKRAVVKGQVLLSIPVLVNHFIWLLGPESKFSDLPSIVFLGNVSKEDAITKILKTLQ